MFKDNNTNSHPHKFNKRNYKTTIFQESFIFCFLLISFQRVWNDLLRSKLFWDRIIRLYGGGGGGGRRLAELYDRKKAWPSINSLWFFLTKGKFVINGSAPEIVSLHEELVLLAGCLALLQVNHSSGYGGQAL